MNNLKWTMAPASESAQGAFANALDLHPLVGQLLVNRGITQYDQAKEFLNPSYQQLIHPEQIYGMKKAVARIATAVQNHERIAIYGDYDSDGVTSTATLYLALQYYGVSPRMYIPHRRNEGYGIHPQAIRRLAGEGVTLIISVDCGITAHEPAEVAKEMKVDLIITDHHQPKETLPDAYAIVHPRLDPAYPNPDLCGAGVSFKLAWALGLAMSGTSSCEAGYGRLLMDLLGFTALGTIADVVPLLGENRAIACLGLQAIPDSPFIGMQALISSARIKDNVDGYQVGFTLSPRLNAAGRMGHAEEALKMFTWASPKEAADIATELEKKNRWRQETQAEIVEEAKAQAEKFRGDSVMVITGKNWHPGVVGIVASRLIDEHYCPMIVLVEKDGRLQGSARSIEGFDLSAALKHCESLLIRWGGHAMAAGLELKTEYLEEFRLQLRFYVDTHCPAELRQRRIDIDAESTFAEITVEVTEQIKRLGPFGSGNRRPLFAFRELVLEEGRTMGTNAKHLMFRARQGDCVRKCIMWSRGHEVGKYGVGQLIDIAAEPEINEWQGRRSVEFLVRDLIAH